MKKIKDLALKTRDLLYGNRIATTVYTSLSAGFFGASLAKFWSTNEIGSLYSFFKKETGEIMKKTNSLYSAIKGSSVEDSFVDFYNTAYQSIANLGDKFTELSFNEASAAVLLLFPALISLIPALGSYFKEFENKEQEQTLKTSKLEEEL